MKEAILGKVWTILAVLAVLAVFAVERGMPEAERTDALGVPYGRAVDVEHTSGHGMYRRTIIVKHRSGCATVLTVSHTRGQRLAKKTKVYCPKARGKGGS